MQEGNGNTKASLSFVNAIIAIITVAFARNKGFKKTSVGNRFLGDRFSNDSFSNTQ